MKKGKDSKSVPATNNKKLCCEVYNLFKVTYKKTQIKEVFVLCTFMPLLSRPADFMAPSHFINVEEFLHCSMVLLWHFQSTFSLISDLCLVNHELCIINLCQ